MIFFLMQDQKDKPCRIILTAAHIYQTLNLYLTLNHLDLQPENLLSKKHGKRLLILILILHETQHVQQCPVSSCSCSHTNTQQQMLGGCVRETGIFFFITINSPKCLAIFKHYKAVSNF